MTHPNPHHHPEFTGEAFYRPAYGIENGVEVVADGPADMSVDLTDYYYVPRPVSWPTSEFVDPDTAADALLRAMGYRRSGQWTDRNVGAERERAATVITTPDIPDDPNTELVKLDPTDVYPPGVYRAEFMADQHVHIVDQFHIHTDDPSPAPVADAAAADAALARMGYRRLSDWDGENHRDAVVLFVGSPEQPYPPYSFGRAEHYEAQRIGAEVAAQPLPAELGQPVSDIGVDPVSP
jgi:hypothetical protein